MKNELLVIVALVLQFAACDTVEPVRYRMDGAWTSTNDALRFTAKEQGGGEFTGGGTMEYAIGGPQPMEMRGIRSGESVTFSLFDRNGRTLNFQGQFLAPERIEGTLSGFTNGSFPYTILRN